MATIRIRYLVERPGQPLPRYFWQPSSELRAQGWPPRRVPLDWAAHSDPHALRAAACAEAERLNAQLDASRAASAANLQPAAAHSAPASRTLGALIAEYQASDAWRGLARSTQRGYAQCLAKLSAWGGDAPIAAIDEVRVQRLRAAMAATPAFANAVVRVLRLLLEHGRRTGWRPWLPVNAASRPGLISALPSGLIWPRAAVTAFVEAADARGRHSLGTAVMLNEWLGQREGDILRLPRTVYRDGRLIVRQSKTGATVSLPIHLVPALQQRLEAELRRTEAKGATPLHIILNEGTGRPYDQHTFRHRFAEVRAAAAKDHPEFQTGSLRPGRDMLAADAFTVRMDDLTFMALRHTAVTRLAEAGCTSLHISAITGHSAATVDQLMRRYHVRTADQADTAFRARLAKEQGL